MKENENLINWFMQAPDKKTFVESYALQNNTDLKEVYRALIDAGIDIKTGGPRKTAPDWVKAVAMHSNGATDKEIAAMLGVALTTVCNWRNRHGLPVNRAPKAERAPRADAGSKQEHDHPVNHAPAPASPVKTSTPGELAAVRDKLRVALAASVPAMLMDGSPAMVKDAAVMISALARMYQADGQKCQGKG